MVFNDVFRALSKEAQFTKEMLGSGATQIRKANYAKKGVYFQSFTSLSTGMERIGKICLMLDHYINNSGKFPDPNYMKKKIGHNIVLLYQQSLKISENRSVSFRFMTNLSGDIHQNILHVLSKFAEGDRYSNVNMLLNGKKSGDPVVAWFQNVDKPLFDRCVTQRRKEKIVRNAQLIGQMTEGFVMVLHTSETGSDITEVDEASFRTGMQEAVAPYRQLYVLQIIRFWVELVIALQYEAMKLGREDIPFMSEIFGPFYNADSYIRTRKTWDTV